jgi:3-methyladenine DNA glycosylase AlkD
VRRTWSKQQRTQAPEFIFEVATELLLGKTHTHRMLAFELLAAHPDAFDLLDDARVDAWADGLADWGSIDLYGVTIAGPAWRMGLVSDSTVRSWARSPDRWRRRLSLVATVPLNARSRGGTGDQRRTLSMCRQLMADRDPMVVKAMSWALRELAKREPAIVRNFLSRHGTTLAPLVRKELSNKLRTGLKSGRSRGGVTKPQSTPQAR